MQVGSHSGRAPVPAAASSARPHRSPPKQNRPQKRRKSSPRQRTASPAVKAASISAAAREMDSASLADFTRRNEEAMQALRSGDGGTSRRILTSLLPELRNRLVQVESSNARAAPDEVVVQSWRLVYALTLNNYGCQLRRDGQRDGALQQFMLAKEVESTVFGKPSCSTMLNLSAVLLSKGEVKEALKIATECAAAAQDGEPVLFITALHNLAVALGQQSSERSRSAALPTMLQALREAQAALGEQHPTTKMLKEKCGLTSQWINSSAAVTPSQPEGSSTLRSNQAPSTVPSQTPPPVEQAPAGFSSAQERARAALYTLNFGQPIAMPRPAAVDNATVDATSTKLEDTAKVARRTSSPTLADRTVRGSLEKTGQKDVLSASGGSQLTPTCVEKRADDCASCGVDASTHQSSKGADDDGDGPRRDSNVAASVDALCLDSAHLSAADLRLPDEGLETVLQEPFRPSVLSLNQHRATTLRELCGREENGSVVYPSFLRFSAPLPPSPLTASNATTHVLPTTQASALFESPSTEGKGSARNANVFAQTLPVDAHAPRPARGSSSTTPAPHSTDRREKERTSLFATAPAVPSAATEYATGSPQTPASARSSTNNSCSNSGRKTQPPGRHTLFGQSSNSSRRPDRAAQRQAALAEEEAYRRKMKAEEAAASATNAFQQGLKRVEERTQTRAAGVIQRAWTQWWSSVGQPRRHVQLRRLQELQRRRRDRLAFAAATGKKITTKHHTVTVPPPPSQQHGRIANYVVPAVVVRCARRWKDRTACVRGAARLTGCSVDPQLHEADLHKRICQLQALWRGALQRLRDNQTRQKKASENTQRADAEARDYAAMIVQCTFRRYAARQARRRLYEERYNAPATRIQQWLRCTWADQRQRGVDAPTLRRQHAAALDIQRVWRGYEGRIRFRMRELRQRIDEANPYALSIERGDTEEKSASQSEAPATQQRLESDLSADEHRISAAEDTDALTQESVAPQPCASAAALSARADEYESQCRARGGAVQHLLDEERDRFHIPLFVETRAAKERTAWQEAIRQLPTDVLRRRAAFNAQIDAEQSNFVRARSARVIQRAFRLWRAMLHDDSRDTRLLQYSLRRYQQQELGRAVERKQQERDFDRAVELYGDTTLPMREERERAATALATAAAAAPDVDHNSNPPASAEQDQRELTFSQPAVLSRAIRSQQRREQESRLHRDERLLALTHAHNSAHLREGPEECKARVGTTYEHPYYVPYVNEEHRRTLGID
ncbi:hypothetical protein ABB37_03353 [Leptomonas pyrrhocoris]|uniref:Uncharacterized protein n=1 Tax=Leptomonas pyrrhocoris TaxID=157538 RepID=A0A0M9G4G9_LEPPY|nr:hypothetical protein ABB37_03353 [Leptomonas pyrrhocoris]XP_015660679.1 hypothetical protein ABB37_03353 [Leptomonas pyrrhocoris]KPA82239.1 hypothetical protein ABB37_03353 [Leptomonas pyrrhocoris]KPA82240.1 hypothetical protein ABB37_03353 [Leptomonas pyrrhocoris]|eukprot:XP_015660678.1 hypothetical protein ABB37_03353 [Leptomonas pyrrhocoris]